MQLLLDHGHREKVFSLWAKYELSGEEQTLVDQYNIRKVVLVEGNPRQEMERAFKMAAVLAVLAGLIAFVLSRHPAPGILAALVTLIRGLDRYIYSYP